MNIYLKPFQELSDVQTVKEFLGKQKKREYYELSGITGSGKANLVYALSDSRHPSILIASDETAAKALYEELSYYRDDVTYYPGKDLLFFQSDIRGNALTIPRVQTISKVSGKESFLAVTTIPALMNIVQRPEKWARGIRTVRTGDTIDITEFGKELVSEGYERVTQVEQPGEFAVRGGIIDFFSLTDEEPVRIELWDDEVDQIKRFDASSQKSTEQIEECVIFPAAEFVFSEDEIQAGIAAVKSDYEALYSKYRKSMKTEEASRLKKMVEEALWKLDDGWIRQEAEVFLPYFLDESGSLLDFLPDDTIVFVDEPRRVEEAARVAAEEFFDSMSRRLEQGYILPGQMELLLQEKDVKSSLLTHSGVLLSMLDSSGKWIKSKEKYHIRMQQGSSFNGSFEMLVSDIKKYRAKKYSVIIVSPSHHGGKRLTDNLVSAGVQAFYSDNIDYDIKPTEVMVTYGHIRQGFEYTDSSFVFISESDIFGTKKKKKRKVKYEGEHISGFRDLNPGDYVVHENHGLGIYRGIEKIEVDGVMKDYIKLEYAAKANLYVLATQLATIQKYGNASDKKPKLNSLGSLEWTKTKEKVKTAVGEIARELVTLYALRQNTNGYVFSPDTEWQQEFEETFPYEETDGQLEAINDVKTDMESTKIMDRLICGDVGFGKTEIALRAAFKAVQENKQVAYLVPTTILAEQHYNTFVQRMKDFPVNVALLSRFRTPQQIKESIKKLKTGEVDIVIGTHRILSKDVEFKDLGLLIIDEEQRFGVGHKEKIKQLKKNVDVLAMSATPIPRTLHMSLAGIRDMSVLEEPPRDRQPIQTFVFEYDDELVREGIQRELLRNGQVFYVINQIRIIADVAAHIQELVPDANVAYAHGRMNEKELEDIMYRFINREIDVLVSTTIIEIGMDITNVNTIIIHDSDRMGLSQLYQLRGRVGRGSRTAYAFFLYKRDKLLKEDAEKRLSAIREFTDLGSGFKIAMRDLEIRGAGNMLGKEQHGHMSAVGYDLYCKMLNEAVKTEKGEEQEVDFDTLVDITIDSYIPQNYIRDEAQKLDIYKRISDISTEEEKSDILDELLDRFGDPPRAVRNLAEVSLLRSECHKAYITEIRERKGFIVAKLYKKAGINADRIPAVIEKMSPYISFQADKNEPSFVIDIERDSKIKKIPTIDIMRNLANTIIEETMDY
jgi:transcription-repair coupling factor (superfamily II helicase)